MDREKGSLLGGSVMPNQSICDLKIVRSMPFPEDTAPFPQKKSAPLHHVLLNILAGLNFSAAVKTTTVQPQALKDSKQQFK